MRIQTCLFVPATVAGLWVHCLTFFGVAFMGAGATLANDHLEPRLRYPQQEKGAKVKLASFISKHRRPNILLLLVDDLGYGDPGVYGGGEAVGAATPNIDRLAHDGLRLTSTYAQPTCTPTRATILTGRLPIRHGLLRPPQIGESMGIKGETTLATLLSDAGYHTAAVGKWHLGEALEYQPQSNGFDEYYGFLGSVKNYTEWRDNRINPAFANDPEVVRRIQNDPDFIRSLIKASRNQPHEELYELDIAAIANVDVDCTRYSVEFIERMAKQEKPWFLYHCFGKVHYDNYAADGFRGSSAAKTPYKDAVVEVDALVGRVLEALEKTGQAKKTLVFLTSDNGPEEDTWPDAGHTPFRGAKSTTWEGGIRVPGIARWPEMIKPGRVSDGLFDLADLFTTFAELGGAKIPTERYIDGIDQSSFLISDDGKSNREAVYSYMGNTFSAMRVGPYKFHRYIAKASSNDGIPGFLNGSTIEKTFGVYAFNLYLDPKERRPNGIRTAIQLKRFVSLEKRHLSTFERHPKKESSNQ